MKFTHSVNMATNYVTKVPMDYTKWPKVIESLSKSSEENFNNLWGHVININNNGSSFILPETPDLTGLMALKTGPNLTHVTGHEYTHLTRPCNWLYASPQDLAKYSKRYPITTQVIRSNEQKLINDALYNQLAKASRKLGKNWYTYASSLDEIGAEIGSYQLTGTPSNLLPALVKDANLHSVFGDIRNYSKLLSTLPASYLGAQALINNE